MRAPGRVEVTRGAAQTMRNRRRQNSPVERLRLAIDCMPVATREAMLQAVRYMLKVSPACVIPEMMFVRPGEAV